MKLLTKKVITGSIAAFAFAVVASLGSVGVVSAQSTDCNTSGGALTGVDCAKGTGQPENLFSGDNAVFVTVTNTLLFIIGAVSVIMLIWGGIRYTTSAGNSSNVTAAKNTIMYAIIGLIIAFLAYAIVNWVLVSLNTAA